MADESGTLRDMYLELLERTLTRAAFPESYRPVVAASSSAKRSLNKAIQGLVGIRGFELVHRTTVDPAIREIGGDWPADAETMIGIRRLRNIRFCIEQILHDSVPGDLIETGVWRGGATIYMRAVLRTFDVSDRTVWVADSFAGLPAPDPAYPADAGSELFANPTLSVGMDEVRRNFERYGLLDDQVRFLPGWFKDTLPIAPIDSLALARLDGDLYESTMDALSSLYPKLSSGGFIIIDDYYSNETCRLAVTDFRRQHRIEEELIDIDQDAVYWRRD